LYEVCVTVDKFPVFSDHLWQITSIFKSTRVQFFSEMEVKGKSRNRLNNERFGSCLRVATFHVCPDIEKLVGKKPWLLTDVLLTFKIKL